MRYKKTGIIAAIVSVVMLAAVVSVFATEAFNKVSEDTTAVDVTTEETTEPENTDPEDSDPAETEPEETIETETEPEAEEPNVRVISVEKGAVMSELATLAQEYGLSDKKEDSVVLELSDVDGLSLTASLQKKGDTASVIITKVHVGALSYDVSFDDILAEYPDAVLDVVSAGDFVAVGMRNYLGTYYVFTEVGCSRFEMTDSEGYYVWIDGNNLCYMKQNRDFERISAGMQVFAQSYSSPDQFYMDFGKVVSFDEGTLGVTRTSWTVQDYFMSDSFVMKAERERYAYTSVDKFVADYNAGTIGAVYPLPDDGMQEEPVPTEEPDVTFDVKEFSIHVDLENAWFTDTFPTDMRVDFPAVVIGDYPNFKAFVMGLDEASNMITEDVVTGETGTVKHTELLKAYDETFFEDKALVMAYINVANVTDSYTFTGSSYSKNKKLTFKMKENTDGASLPMSETRLYAIEVNRQAVLFAEDVAVYYDYSNEIMPNYSHTINPYGNGTSANLSQYMYKPNTVQPSFPVISLYPDPAPKVKFPTFGGNTDPWKVMTQNR